MHCIWIASRKNDEGISQIPEEYSAPEGRKIVDDSTDLASRLSHPNKYVAMFAGILGGVIVVLIVLAIVIRNIVRKHKKTGKEK